MSLVLTIMFSVLYCVSGLNSLFLFLFLLDSEILWYSTHLLNYYKYVWYLFSLIFFNFQGADDPCVNGNFKFLHTPGLRGGACKLQPTKIICDHYISDGWYKVLHEDDQNPRTMLEGRVSAEYCGTVSPIWLNGKFKVNSKLSLILSLFFCIIYFKSD